jgi:hypothetical protein
MVKHERQIEPSFRKERIKLKGTIRCRKSTQKLRRSLIISALFNKRHCEIRVERWILRPDLKCSLKEMDSVPRPAVC